MPEAIGRLTRSLRFYMIKMSVPLVAERIAEALPPRNGQAWSAQAVDAWWSTAPAAQLTQGDRALIVVARPWHTEVAWTTSDREPDRPDLKVESLSVPVLTGAILRRLLPEVDAHLAAQRQSGATDGLLAWRESITAMTDLITALALPGVRAPSLHSDTSSTSVEVTLPSGVHARFGRRTDPLLSLHLTGSVRALELLLPVFLPAPTDASHSMLTDVRGRYARRFAAHLARFTTYGQRSDGAVDFTGGGYIRGTIAAPRDPKARVQDYSPAAVQFGGVGFDWMLANAVHLVAP
ncbi:hypothetical protein [Streptomyces sp. NPDC101455]|uniref:hypothetical protein n=1 Tax=Streptomyces sp. NPDC101455 TaxID=3366142 RepID=UPI0037FDCE32